MQRDTLKERKLGYDDDYPNTDEDDDSSSDEDDEWPA
jgi:hypothetical protein